MTARMQRVLDRLLAVDTLNPWQVIGFELQTLYMILADLEEVVAASGSGTGLDDRLQQCKDELGVLGGRAQTPGGANLVTSADAAPAAALLASVARSVLREIDRKTGDGMGRQETTLFDRMVYAVPVVLVFMFLVVYFSSGMVATLDNSMQVYWRGDGQPYQEGNSVRQCAVMDGEWHNYEFDTAGAGSVRVRLDPVGDGRLARRIEIRRIAYYIGRNSTWQEADLGSWPCENCRLEYDGDYLEVWPEGVDPWLELPRAAGGVVSRVMIEARILPARLPPWRWLQLFTGRQEANPDCPAVP